MRLRLLNGLARNQGIESIAQVGILNRTARLAQCRIGIVNSAPINYLARAIDHRRFGGNRDAGCSYQLVAAIHNSRVVAVPIFGGVLFSLLVGGRRIDIMQAMPFDL